MATPTINYSNFLTGRGPLFGSGNLGPVYADPVPMPAPAPQPAMPSNAQRFWNQALLTGGQVALGSPEQQSDPATRAYLLGLQRQAQFAEASARTQQMLRQAQQNAALNQNTFNPNGVNNGVAYMNGVPVGFAGNVTGVRPGIPEAGFTNQERTAFNRQLMALATQAGNPVAGPLDQEVPGPMIGRLGPPVGVTGQMGSPVAAAAVPAAPVAPLYPAVPDAVTAAKRLLTPNRRAGMTANEAAREVANTERGLEARNAIVSFEEKLPDLLAVLTAENRMDIDADMLAEEIVRAWSPGRKSAKDLAAINPFNLKQASALAQRLGFDPKLLLRWAQDRKKAKT